MRPFERLLVFYIVSITYFLSIQKKSKTKLQQQQKRLGEHESDSNDLRRKKNSVIHMFTLLCYLRVHILLGFSRSSRDFCEPTNRTVIIFIATYRHTERSEKRKSSIHNTQPHTLTEHEDAQTLTCVTFIHGYRSISYAVLVAEPIAPNPLNQERKKKESLMVFLTEMRGYML